MIDINDILNQMKAEHGGASQSQQQNNQFGMVIDERTSDSGTFQVVYEQPSQSFLGLLNEFHNTLVKVCNDRGLDCIVVGSRGDSVVDFQVGDLYNTNVFRYTNDGIVASWSRVG